MYKFCLEDIKNYEISYGILTMLKSMIPSIRKVYAVKHSTIMELSDLYLDCDLSPTEVYSLSLYLISEIIDDEPICELHLHDEFTPVSAVDITELLKDIPTLEHKKETIINQIRTEINTNTKLCLMYTLVNSYPPEDDQFDKEFLQTLNEFCQVYVIGGKVAAYPIYKKLYDYIEPLRELFSYYDTEIYL